MKDTIKQMRTAVLNAPGQVGVLQGLVAILENATDSSLIAFGFEDVNPDVYSDKKLKIRISDLLLEAGYPQISVHWDPRIERRKATNVVDFHATKANLDESSDRNLIGSDGGPKITFNDVGGLENVKKQMRRRIIDPFLKKELFARFKRRAGGGVLMYGPPGCGKTMLAKALAHECNANFLNVKAADVLDKWIGESEKNITQIFHRARENRPVVLFLMRSRL